MKIYENARLVSSSQFTDSFINANHMVGRLSIDRDSGKAWFEFENSSGKQKIDYIDIDSEKNVQHDEGETITLIEPNEAEWIFIAEGATVNG